MNWRKGIFFLFVAALAGAAILEAWSWRGHLLANKGLYLTNNQHWAEAERVLRSAEAAGERERAQYLLARLELNTGKPAEALRRLEGLRGRRSVDADRGTALYLLGETTAALAAFREAAAAEPAADGLAALAAAALSDKVMVRGSVPEPIAAQVVDRLMWNAMAGRVALREGRYSESANALERAIAWGDTNPETPFLAAVAGALAADYARAEHLAGPRMADPAFRSQLAQYFDGLTSQSAAPEFSQTALARVTLRRLNAVRARGWIETRGALMERDTADLTAALSRLDSLLEDWPRDLLLRMWRAQILTALGRDREAFLAYRELQQSQPTYAVALRILDLAGPDEKLMAEADEILSSTAVAAVVPPGNFVSSGPLHRAGLLAFLEDGTAEATVSVAQAGEYDLLAVGRADPAAGVWPRLDVDINGARAGYIIAASEEWDCFSLRSTLRSGDNRLKLIYGNDREHPSPIGEDRNFYLRQIILGRTDSSSGN
ncbi:MAG: hypothetical protein N2111_09235 [Candidatus Sumerlaeaceae bacterium]|nr:hypothetical protein [Candidatus Sumerlaeaceae bacterium]